MEPAPGVYGPDQTGGPKVSCPFCQSTDHKTPEACPRVAAIDYEFGKVKRIEFVTAPVIQQAHIVDKRFDLGTDAP